VARDRKPPRKVTRAAKSTNFDLDLLATLGKNRLPGDTWADVVNRWVRIGLKSEGVEIEVI